jgi:hypothetical protein
LTRMSSPSSSRRSSSSSSSMWDQIEAEKRRQSHELVMEHALNHSSVPAADHYNQYAAPSWSRPSSTSRLHSRYGVPSSASYY